MSKTSVMRALFLLLIASIAFSCGPQDRAANLPKAAGASGDIYLFMDSTQWRSPVGKAMDSIFNQDMVGLPRPEGIFRMSWVDPRKMNFVLKQRRNLIFVVTLDQMGPGAQIIKNLFTAEQLAKIETDTAKFTETYKNVYAKDQQVMFLFAKDQETLLRKLNKNGQKLIDFFNKVERDRLNSTLFSAGTVTGVSDWLKKNFQVSITIPYGYKLVQNEQDFVWVRQINVDDDKDIFIARTEYTSLDQFKQENLIKLRNDICRKYIFEDPEKPNTYLITETEDAPVITREVNFNGQYAVEMRGLWLTNTHTMGGPFLSYALSDQATGKFFYVEAFVYGPSKDQREMMRQMEVVLNTFRLESNQAAPAASK
jgi:hypothetical protein